MDYAASIFTVVQFFFALVIGLYFWNLLRSQQGSKVAVEKESHKEIDKLRHMREISLTEPLSERTRPQSFAEIIGQDDGLKGLRAALCGPNPQHVLIYGPPGVGKTAAARLVLEEAKRGTLSPFKPSAKFVELDATTARFDERGIADPLIGSVHDPIYQGAGPLGMAGIPQPKPGAVTRAHGGMLFIDEIGELHPIQMNKLLKVLEDRKVYFESAYYSSEDPNIPTHIRDIFENGLPADFRMVGATTRAPEEIPPAIRSRCVEIFFRQLRPLEVECVARNAAKRVGIALEPGACALIGRYATNGREAVNVVQIAAGLAITEERSAIVQSDIEWVVEAERLSPRPERHVPDQPQIGVVNGLAVFGPHMGLLLEIEVMARQAKGHRGSLEITGIVEEEELGSRGKNIRRKSMAHASVRNVMTVLAGILPMPLSDFDLHVNFPGGMPVDGPSAGVSMACAIYSAITGRPVDNRVAMTGELSLRGQVRPVGGIMAKIEAARDAGAERVLIPAENMQESFAQMGVEVIGVHGFDEVLNRALLAAAPKEESSTPTVKTTLPLAAAPQVRPPLSLGS